MDETDGKRVHDVTSSVGNSEGGDENVVDEDDAKAIEEEYVGLGLALGVAFGVVFGDLLFENVGMGIAIGLALGLSLGAAYGRRAALEAAESDENETEESAD